ncbi:hypothetical protein EJB05_44982, partial [Eragrostis curvula]
MEKRDDVLRRRIFGPINSKPPSRDLTSQSPFGVSASLPTLLAGSLPLFSTPTPTPFRGCNCNQWVQLVAAPRRPAGQPAVLPVTPICRRPVASPRTSLLSRSPRSGGPSRRTVSGAHWRNPPPTSSATSLAVIPSLPAPLRLVAWPVYWAAQGCALGGVWVIAHECGHHAFSEHAASTTPWGSRCHTALLVPTSPGSTPSTTPWGSRSTRRCSSLTSPGSTVTGATIPTRVHSTATTCSCRGAAPSCRSELHPYARGAAGRPATLALQLLLGWPLYLSLSCNAAGRPHPRFASHFDPYSPIFSGRRERLQVVPSDAGVLAVLLALCRLAAAHRLGAVARVYGAPLVVVNAWLVLVTYLQHTDPAVPRYAGREWDWLRSPRWTATTAPSSTKHSTTSPTRTSCTTSSRPCRTTTPPRPPPRSARFDATPITRAAWRAAKECVYVEPDGSRDGVFWYGNNF